MSGGAAEAGLLKQAFRRFEEAAGTLEERHATLGSEVDRLKRELLDANRRLETVLDSLDDGLAVLDADDRLSRANRAFERLGLVGPDGRLTHTGLSDLVEGDRNGGGTTTIRGEIGGEARELRATLIPVCDSDGTRVLTLQDVTRIRREAEEGGRRLRLEALGRMAAELAHEVRNPLGSIRLFAGMLHEDLERKPEQASMAEQILAATAGLEGLVSNLLAFAAPACGARTRVDLAAQAQEACALLRPACSVRGVRLDGPGDGESCPVEGQTEGLRQVLLNLLGNALAATGEGGRIRVSVRGEPGRAVLEVEDSGHGIDPGDLPHVFDPFFSRTEGGSGLGLSIVHNILERNGGRITLDSRPGHGTRAIVELPATEREEDA